MKKSLILSAVFSFIFLFNGSVFAAGLGIAFPFGSGTTDYDLYEADASRFGINFVFDSNVANNRVFNYRLNAGVEFFTHDYEEEYYSSYYGYYDYYSYSNEGIRIVTDHTFGFGIVRTSVVRLWLGPTVRIGFVSEDESGITLGAGLTALGLNFNFGPVFTIGLEAGYLFNADLYFDDVAYEEDYYYEDSSSTGLNQMFVVKLSFLFRINDTYDDFF